NTRQFHVQRSYRDVDRHYIVPRDFAQQIQIADDQIRFRDNTQLQAAVANELFQDSAGHFIAPLCRLVRIGGSAKGNGFAWFDPTQVTPQQIRGVLLDIDFLLEFHAVTHFHKFVSVAGITVLAGELTTAIRINRPGKRHAYAGASVQQGARGQREV